MITCSDEFKTAIKADMRECVTKVVLNYSTPLALTDEKIQSININSSAEIALGGVQNDDISIILMENALSEEQFNQDIDVEILIGCMVNDAAEYISIGTYVADGWGKNEKTGLITINLSNKISSNASIKENIIAQAGTDIKDYAAEIIKSVFGADLVVSTDITSQFLEKSWLYYDDIVQQLKQIGVSCNGLFRHVSDFELVPYKHTSEVDTLKMGPNESTLEVSRISDYSKVKSNVQILKSAFCESTVEKLTSSNLKTTGGEITDFELSTNCPTTVKYVVIKNEYGRLMSITNAITKCTVNVLDVYGAEKHTIPVEVYGSKVESILKDKKLVTDGSATYIENPYIQKDEHIAALDDSIYNAVKYKVKYRGNPCFQIGDTIKIETDNLNCSLLIYKHTLNYNGGISGTIEGVCVDG